MLTEAYEGLVQAGLDADLRLAVVAANLALHHMRGGEEDLAANFLEQAWRIRRAVAPDTTAVVAAQIAEIRLRQKRPDDALPFLRESWQQARKESPNSVIPGLTATGLSWL